MTATRKTVSRSRNEPRRAHHPNKHNDERVDDVELLLDAEGPVVQQRRRRRLRKQVVGIRRLVVDVGEKEGGPCAVYRGLVSDQRADRVVRHDDGDDDDERRHRDDAPRPAAVEAAERCTAPSSHARAAAIR